MKQYLTTEQAAKELGCSTVNIRKHIQRGNITPLDYDGWQTFISRAEIERFKANRRKPGRPGKDQNNGTV